MQSSIDNCTGPYFSDCLPVRCTAAKPRLRFLLGVWWCEGEGATVCAQSLAEAFEIWREGLRYGGTA